MSRSRPQINVGRGQTMCGEWMHLSSDIRRLEDYYVYIGTYYVFNLMEGEAVELLETGKREIQVF